MGEDSYVDSQHADGVDLVQFREVFLRLESCLQMQWNLHFC